MPKPMTKAELNRRMEEAPHLSNNHFVVLNLKIKAIVEYLNSLKKGKED